MVQASPTGIIILDPDEKIKMMNPTAELFMGVNISSAKGIQLKDLNKSSLAKEIIKISLNETSTISVSGLKKYKIHKSSL
ncbi:MAG: PAS domain-containing protein [Bacteroidales bacterium]|nr:PAS domain-containing protein [Bacteroidales bacterium]